MIGVGLKVLAQVPSKPTTLFAFTAKIFVNVLKTMAFGREKSFGASSLCLVMLLSILSQNHDLSTQILDRFADAVESIKSLSQFVQACVVKVMQFLFLGSVLIALVASQWCISTPDINRNALR